MTYAEAKVYAGLINIACDMDKGRVHIMEQAKASRQTATGVKELGPCVVCRTGSITHFLDTPQSVLIFLQPILADMDRRNALALSRELRKQYEPR